MPAFAKDMTEHPSKEDEDKLLPLFSADEIIFPDGEVKRPYTRYGYTTSGLNFLIPEKTVSEVIQSPNIFILPNSPIWIEGLVNVRGNIVPVMNVGKLLKEFKKETASTILILNDADNNPQISILISELPVSLEVGDRETLADNSPEILQGFVSDGFNKNNVSWIEFNPEELFKKLSHKDDK